MSGDDITSETMIREAIERYPATREVFCRHGLDACCGGIHAIGVAALARGLDPDHLLREVRAAASGRGFYSSNA